MVFKAWVLILITCSTSWAREQSAEHKYKFSNGSELIHTYLGAGNNIVSFKDTKFDKIKELAIGHIYLSSSFSQSSSYRVNNGILNLNSLERSFAITMVDSNLFITFENGNTIIVDSKVESDLSDLQIKHQKVNDVDFLVLSYHRDQAREKGYTYLVNSSGQIMRLDRKYHNLMSREYFFDSQNNVFNLNDKTFNFRSLEESLIKLETPIELTEKSISVKNLSYVNGALEKEGLQVYQHDYKELNPREAGVGENAEEKEQPWYEKYVEQLRGVDIIENVDQNLKRRIYEALVDPESGSAVLVSKPGAGKTTLTNLIAWEIINRKAPSFFDSYEVLYFDASTISAGSKFRGEFEDRVKELKTISQNQKVLWVIDNFTSLKGEGSHSNSNKDILDMIAPDLSKGNIRILAMADIDLYDQVVTNEQIRSKVTKINVEQKWGERELIKVIQNYVLQKYDHKISPQHVRALLELAEKGEATSQEPARTLRLARKVMNKKLLLSKEDTFKLSKKTIQDSAAELYGFDPAEYKADAAQEKLEQLEKALRTNVIGQEMMVELKAAKLVYTNTHDESKARMGLFFTGPRGLGKTEVPKVYAEAMGKPFYRISMGQYSTPEPGTLEKLKHTIYRELQKNPNTVLFFDELDKSPMFIQDGLLELFDSKTFNVREKLDVSGSLSKIVHVDISKADVFFAGNSAVEYVYSLSVAQQQELTNRIGFHAEHNQKPGQVLVDLNPHLKLDKSLLELVIMREEKISPYLLSRMVEIVPAFPSNPNTFTKILSLHVERAIDSLEKKLGLIIEFNGNDKEYLSEKLSEIYWEVNRDNRVDGIIIDWLREPISRAIDNKEFKASKGYKIYVTGANNPNQVVVLPKEMSVDTAGYTCKRLFN